MAAISFGGVWFLEITTLIFNLSFLAFCVRSFILHFFQLRLVHLLGSHSICCSCPLGCFWLLSWFFWPVHSEWRHYVISFGYQYLHPLFVVLRFDLCRFLPDFHPIFDCISISVFHFLYLGFLQNTFVYRQNWKWWSVIRYDFLIEPFIFTTALQYLFLSVILFIFLILCILDSGWPGTPSIAVVSCLVKFCILRLQFLLCQHSLARCPFFHI